MTKETKPLYSKEFIRDVLGDYFKKRAVYKGPGLTDDEVRKFLADLGYKDLLTNPISGDEERIGSISPTLTVPLTDTPTYRDVLDEAFNLIAQQVMVPNGQLAPEEVAAYVQDNTHKALQHDVACAGAFTEEMFERGVQAFFGVYFYTSCEIAGINLANIGSGNRHPWVEVGDYIVPLVLVENARLLTPDEQIAIASAPGDDMSVYDHQVIINANLKRSGGNEEG